VVAVAAVVVCFLLTISLCFLLGGGGFLAAMGLTAWRSGDEVKFYAIVAGGYSDLTLARSAASLMQSGGGAGYVLKSDEGETYDLYLNVYETEDEAKGVADKLSSSGAYIKTLSGPALNLKWAGKDISPACEDALKYFDLTFSALKKTAGDFEDDLITFADAKNAVKVLASRLSDIKTAFYENVSGSSEDKVTDIKMALITAQALVDNVEISKEKAVMISSLRYQCIQLTLSHLNLLAQLAE
jgi:hypothetical protein